MRIISCVVFPYLIFLLCSDHDSVLKANGLGGCQVSCECYLSQAERDSYNLHLSTAMSSYEDNDRQECLYEILKALQICDSSVFLHRIAMEIAYDTDLL